MQVNLPAFFYYNKVILLDDDRDFLDTAIEYLKDINKYMKIDGYINPYDVVLKDNDRIKNCIQARIRDDVEKNTLSYDILQSSLSAFNLTKDDVSVLVVDYDMPSVDGLSFIKKLDKSNIYKILLTGVADENIAIQAFNNGLIDAYIKKQDPDALKRLYKKIIDFQLNFFEKETSEIINAVLKIEENSLLGSAEYKEVLYKKIKENDINQYYLIDEIGSYYMLSDTKDYVMYITERSKNLSLIEYLEEKNINKQSKAFYNFVNNLKNTNYLLCDQLVYNDLINECNFKNYKKQGDELVVNNKKYLYFFSENKSNDKKHKLFKFAY